MFKKNVCVRIDRGHQREMFVPNTGNEYSDKPVSVSNLL